MEGKRGFAMNILGVNAFHGDASVALLGDGRYALRAGEPVGRAVTA